MTTRRRASQQSSATMGNRSNSNRDRQSSYGRSRSQEQYDDYGDDYEEDDNNFSGRYDQDRDNDYNDYYEGSRGRSHPQGRFESEDDEEYDDYEGQDVKLDSYGNQGSTFHPTYPSHQRSTCPFP